VAFHIINLRRNLSLKTKTELQSYALSIENFAHKGKEVFGGIHDYVNLMTEEELITYITTVCLEKKELLEENFFKSVVEGKKEDAEDLSFGGLHDYIFKTDRKTLEKWAFTCEAHEKRLENLHFMGGLHDYIERLTDTQIANYILAKAKRFKELNSKENLEKFGKQYSIQIEEAPLKAAPIGKLGGLEDFIFRTERKTLINWALTCEAYDRRARKVHLLGGLDEYIHTLSDEKIAEYVLEMAGKYPELNSKQNLEKFGSELEINYIEEDHKNISLKFLQ
jgi:hypothetical protein